MSFKVDLQEKEGKMHLIFSGDIDEFVEFPEIEVSGGGELFVDLQGVSSVNSIGIRAWLEWVKIFEGKAIMNFINCPKSVVMQMNMVEGFLPARSKVISFYVPYYNETTDEEKDVLFEVGKHVVLEAGEPVIKLKDAAVFGAEFEVEMDVNPSKYFKFLKSATSQAA